MAEMNWETRRKIAQKREEAFEKRREKLKGEERELALALNRGYFAGSEQLRKIQEEFYSHPEKKPSQWFVPPGEKKSGLSVVRQEFLNTFVPKPMQPSFLLIIDKLNQFPFARGWGRRSVRTAGYGPQIYEVFSLLKVYEKLFYFGQYKLEDYILGRLDEERLSYIRSEYTFTFDFGYLYAAEIDRGNEAVIQALRDVIYSENNTSYLDREMIRGILRSSHKELQESLCKLLLAARLQEGLRQAICESMDEGTTEAFLMLLQVIEDNNLIRFSSVQRSVSVWIGIGDPEHTERITGKLLALMDKCLRDGEFCKEQLATEDAIGISVALWALGFYEVEDAISSMKKLVDHGTRHQRLAVSYYNQMIHDEKLRSQVAEKILLEYGEDLELAAAYMPVFLSRTHKWIYDVLDGRLYDSKPRKPKTMDIQDCFGDRQKAERLYQRFQNIYQQLPKKGLVYNPCIFPWYKVELEPSSVITQLVFLAYVLGDEEKITSMAELLGESVSTDRANLLNLLLYEPSGERQRQLVIGYMGNADTKTSAYGVDIVKRLDLTQEEYQQVEELLRFKRSQLRNILIELLMDQPEKNIDACLKRLLKDKREEKRTAGLDMLLRLSKEEKRAALYERVRGMASLVEKPSDKEKILLAELLGDQKEAVEEKKGYGIYDPDAPEELLGPGPEEPLADPAGLLARFMPLSWDKAAEKIQKLDQLFQDNKDYEYTNYNGEKTLLGNAYSVLMGREEVNVNGQGRMEDYPLSHIFLRFYQEEINDYFQAVQMREMLHWGGNSAAKNAAKLFYETVFGCVPETPRSLSLKYRNHVATVLKLYMEQFEDKKMVLDTGVRLLNGLYPVINRENKIIRYEYTTMTGRKAETTTCISNLFLFSRYFTKISQWENEEDFKRGFAATWKLEVKCQDSRKRRRFIPVGGNTRDTAMTGIRPYWFFKAYHMGMISLDILYKAVLEYFAREDCLKVLCEVKKGEGIKPKNCHVLEQFFGWEMTRQIYKEGETFFGQDTWLGDLIRQLYDQIVPVLVDVELRRGEAETEFSWDMRGVSYICGVDYLVRILMALGKDTLDRDSYYVWGYGGNKRSKKEVLSNLLKACYPGEHETGADLKKALMGTSIKEPRLVEVAMYAPQWIDVLEQYLGWKGLKSGCYYFMAHMNEYFDDQKKAMIARFTPLSPEELQNGAFDVTWFEEAYHLLGEKNFGLLYNGAKYISNGTAHSRGRKYADAATGKVTLEALRQEIGEKRNKDLLMSYGLVPFEKDRDKDLLERYEFIQQYLKESRQFGAQRRASEAKAAEIALVNLSVRAGFGDVTRLTMNMESRLADAFSDKMEWTQVEDVEICLKIQDDGKSQILCRKNGKELKSVPSRLGKNPYVVEVKAAHKKLKDQYSRTRFIMEDAMEHGTLFAVSEICQLFDNPVVRAILEPLVFLHKGEGSKEDMAKDHGDDQIKSTLAVGFVKGMKKEKAGSEKGSLCLTAWNGQEVWLSSTDEISIAHPFDLYQTGQWHEYQKFLFDKAIRQPFKQVFRELYVKLPEEMGQKYSRMFAGNQIQPARTVGCLRSRRWIADYEEGLQKIFYKENIIARIYALADWFSPSDVESPTLEWVEFSDRKTFRSLTMEEVPDLIYSEVMRDVDLAVSVAHAGGVDPETSHSTIEMRHAIVEFNLPLFGLKNVTLSDSHALIRGSRGVYNVHLGSGVVHQEGGAMLNILPVHSQKRGKLFLPFVDEDPKTAEIMSKIVLLSEDKKIKDPFILDQIIRN